MTADNRRADYRINVPVQYVRQMAVWPCADTECIRLPLEQLGAPLAFCTIQDTCMMQVQDISTQGLGVLLSMHQSQANALQSAAACYTYLQLWDPSTEDPYGMLSIFTANRVVRTVMHGDALYMGLRFIRFAIGSHMEKQLEFLDAQVCGVSALAHWCDNLSRGEFIHPGQARNGLDLDNLLSELSFVLNTPKSEEPHIEEPS